MNARPYTEKVTITGLCLLFCLFQAIASEQYCFRVYLKDKGPTPYSTDKPEEFLSAHTIEKRIKRNIPVTTSDLPIVTAYLDSLQQTGATVVTQSKWLATVVVSAGDSLVADKLQELSIVDSVKWIWKGNTYPNSFWEREEEPLCPEVIPQTNEYGYGEAQIALLNGERLHTAGYKGKGMRIAVIDAGFMNVDRICAFSSTDLIGTKNIVTPERSVFTEDDHGTKVLACLAANLPYKLVGTAPGASYLLIKSEDSRSEYPIEEDYWAAAVEYADSVGVDLITSSLGYFAYDAGELSYEPSALDGNTAQITRAARMAAEKGILVFSSAGNEGNGKWGKITFPADAEKILTVGAVTEDKTKSLFSSVGFTADYRVKPDVVALGTNAWVIDRMGQLRQANGTSFATPTLAGLAACLWEALPWLENHEIISLIKESASQYNNPDAELGYGIPDMYKAYRKGIE
ncbi:MAG: S8 family serine peptidase [Tannerellaceae bacterium]|nr:S8 family serine peptidase [Tannerellaceae bacterium]